jgi:mannose-6-phosphate isomerase-like protein (cupin superfamily)
MRRVLFTMLIAALGCLAQAPATAPAAGAPAQQGPGGGGGRGGNAARPSNEQLGVDIDRFIGYPSAKTTHLSHGTLLTHSILRAGDPYKPGPQGSVLEYRKELVTATLMPGSETPLSTLEDAYFFYIKSGEGRLDDGKQCWDLHEGIAILAPPNVPHRFVNGSREKELSMIMLQFTGAPEAHHELIVRDVPKLPWCEENAHWNNASRCVFGTADGLLQGERIYLVMLQPWAASQPHSHGQGTEEIWTKVTPGTALMLLGSELREMPENSAYLVPPTGTVDHSNLNLSKDRTEWWIYVARGPAPAPGAAGGRGGGRGGGGGRGANPNLSRDTTAATVAGKPFK